MSATFDGVIFVLVFDTGLTELQSRHAFTCTGQTVDLDRGEHRKVEMATHRKEKNMDVFNRQKRLRTLVVVMFAMLMEDFAISIHCFFSNYVRVAGVFRLL